MEASEENFQCFDDLQLLLILFYLISLEIKGVGGGYT